MTLHCAPYINLDSIIVKALVVVIHESIQMLTNVGSVACMSLPMAFEFPGSLKVTHNAVCLLVAKIDNSIIVEARECVPYVDLIIASTYTDCI